MKHSKAMSGRKAGAGEKKDRLPPGIANPIDIHVGGRVRLRRTMLGFSQERLGNEVGLTFQQIQKYERGANRIGASRLYELSQVLDVSISYFFEDMAGEIKTRKGWMAKGLSDKGQESLETDPMVRRETLELVRAYYRISNAQVRKKLFELTKSLSKVSKSS
jgi:transcriptional regulator with XRE-family HTH domain